MAGSAPHKKVGVSVLAGPLHTWLLKECIAELVPTISDIVNMLLREK